MKRFLFYAFLSVFLLLLFSWCSMMPDDEEIIRWSILENEIFWDWLLDYGLNEEEILPDDKELLADDGDENENLQDEDYESFDDEENLDWNVVVDAQ